ncbi:probable pectinesterase 29 [Punica granatum]|uniref:Pectinesterase n=2 Tax=Punica granatum TaxID=22663 RepID=A0A2I0L370_PUNGR|nr:probable pectinesterase 29 [Punica granatum]PKI75073.1 hypothetical protein CRG98_004547 [Punica granatum]
MTPSRLMMINILACLLLLLRVSSVTGRLIGGGGDDNQWVKTMSGVKIGKFQKIHVGQHGNFSTIQSAIDSVPNNNQNWVVIKIDQGTYREKVTIPYDKPYIILKGKAKRTTEVVWDDHETVAQSPTFTCLADNVIVKCITFRNSYNNPVNGNRRVPAAAAMVTGDKLYFYRVGFFGLQDTLWDDRGRHYFRKCTIQGAVDFIFGAGQSIYEACSISVLGNALAPNLPGFITAHGRTDPNDSSGFIFKGCNIFGSGSAYLGRPWRGYARVLFYRCFFSDVVEPTGWDAWGYVGNEHQLTFAEYECYGPGANTGSRVSWESNFSWDQVKQLTEMSFIDSADWLYTIPYQKF